MKPVKIEVKEKHGWRRKIKIIVYNLDGSIEEVVELENTLTEDIFNAVRDALKSVTPIDLKIKYLAWGSNNTATDKTHHILFAEFGRKQVTQQAPGEAGILVTTTYIAPTEGNEETIEELAWFAGPLATATPDSGVMVGRVLTSPLEKNALKSWQTVRTDTFSEVV